MNLSAPFIKRPIMTTLVMIGIILFGVFAYKSLPVSDLPNIDYPTITVYAYQPGGSPQYMADTIASPLERNLTAISDLNSMISKSTSGSTQIVLNFNLDVDVNSKEVEVQAAITETLPFLPPMPTNPTFNKTNPSQTPIMFLVLHSETATLAELYEYGYDFLAQPLSMIKGVSSVETYGYPYAVRVQVDPMKAVAYDTDLNEITNSLITANPNLPGGTLQGVYQNITISALGQGTAAETYNKVIIKEVDGLPLQISDIGKAIDGLQNRYPYFRYITPDKNQTTVVLGISRLPGSNTLNISEDIFNLLPKLQKGLPSSVNLSIFYNKAHTITENVKDLQWILVISLIFVVLVIFIYLGKFFDTLIPALVLPLAILCTFIIMYLMGFNIDNLSLLALTLAIGFIVDDSVVVLENIVRHAEMQEKPYQAAMEGSKEINITVFTMTLALSAVFIPMIWMPGILGKIFKEFSLTIVIAILCSGFISLSLNPMLCSRFLKERNHHKKSIFERFSLYINTHLLKIYDRGLQKSLHYKKTVLLVGGICLLLSFAFLKILPTTFLPATNIDLLEGQVVVAEGSSFPNTIRHQKLVDATLAKYPYITELVSIAGYPDFNQGLVFANLVPAKKRPAAAHIASNLMQDLSSITGINTYLKSVPLIDLQVGNTSSFGDYQYILTSLDAKLLYDYADVMTQKFQQIPEISGVNNDLKVKSPQLKLQIDRERAGMYSVTAEEIETTLRSAYSGGRISTFNLRTNLYDLIVEVDPAYDLTSKDVDLLYIKSKTTGQLVPMTSVASWEPVLGPATVSHINTFPAVTISFGLKPEASLGPVIKKIDTLAKETLPDKISGAVQGSAEIFLKTFESIAYLIVIAIIVIYLLLGILYESFIHPLTILSALPAAVFGGLFTLWIFQEQLSLYSVVGLIVLIGLVQKNGIMMIDFALEYMEKKKESAQEAIIEACRVRFRPIMMTTVAAIMGALPVAIGLGTNGDANRPLGLVVVGGLFFSQLITLFLIPIVFLYMSQFQSYLAKKIKPQPNEAVENRQ